MRGRRVATADDAALIRPTFHLKTNKVFWLFFSKKNNFLFEQYPAFRVKLRWRDMLRFPALRRYGARKSETYPAVNNSWAFRATLAGLICTSRRNEPVTAVSWVPQCVDGRVDALPDAHISIVALRAWELANSFRFRIRHRVDRGHCVASEPPALDHRPQSQHAIEHHHGAGLAIIAGPAAEAGADPCRVG